MVEEFEAVVFDDKVPISSVQGPVSTQFGYHLILVEDRTVNDVRSEGEGFLFSAIFSLPRKNQSRNGESNRNRVRHRYPILFSESRSGYQFLYS